MEGKAINYLHNSILFLYHINISFILIFGYQSCLFHIIHKEENKKM